MARTVKPERAKANQKRVRRRICPLHDECSPDKSCWQRVRLTPLRLVSCDVRLTIYRGIGGGQETHDVALIYPHCRHFQPPAFEATGASQTICRVLLAIHKRPSCQPCKSIGEGLNFPWQCSRFSAAIRYLNTLGPVKGGKNGFIVCEWLLEYVTWLARGAVLIQKSGSLKAIYEVLVVVVGTR